MFSTFHNFCWCSLVCYWKHPSWAYDCGLTVPINRNEVCGLYFCAIQYNESLIHRSGFVLLLLFYLLFWHYSEVVQWWIWPWIFNQQKILNSKKNCWKQAYREMDSIFSPVYFEKITHLINITSESIVLLLTNITPVSFAW